MFHVCSVTSDSKLVSCCSKSIFGFALSTYISPPAYTTEIQQPPPYRTLVSGSIRQWFFSIKFDQFPMIKLLIEGICPFDKPLFDGESTMDHAILYLKNIQITINIFFFTIHKVIDISYELFKFK